MATRNVRKFIISALVGVIVTGISMNMFNKLQKEIKAKDQLIEVMQMRDKQIEAVKYNYIIAIHDLEAGTTIKKEDIMLKSFSAKQEDGLTSEDMVIGNVLLESIKEGNILTGYAFTGVSPATAQNTGLREGYRALTLATSSLDGLSKEMKEGTYVDIFSKSKNNNFVLSKIRILSLEPTTSTSTQSNENAEQKDAQNEKKTASKKDKTNISITQAKTVTFEVPVNKIQDLVEIYSSSKILLVMRPIGDDTVITTKNTQTSSPKYDSTTYNTASLPPLPPMQSLGTPTTSDFPVPDMPKVKKEQKSVELIEADDKTKVFFD